MAHGPASFEQLVTVMPNEGLSADAAAQACRTTLLRLKVKKEIRAVPEGYARA